MSLLYVPPIAVGSSKLLLLPVERLVLFRTVTVQSITSSSRTLDPAVVLPVHCSVDAVVGIPHTPVFVMHIRIFRSDCDNVLSLSEMYSKHTTSSIAANSVVLLCNSAD